MKKGVLVAVLALVIIIVLLALVAGYIYIQFTREPYIAENSILKINLYGEIVDSDDSFFSRKYSVRDLWYHIARAKRDQRIKGIILKISYMQSGFAKIEDIGRMLTDFRKSGKKVYAFIEDGGLKEYFLATFADKIYTLKGVSLTLNGLAVEAVFLKETFAKLGIKGEYYHIAEYKTAANMFTEAGFTPAHRESLQKLLDDIFAAVIEKIAVNRKIKKEIVRQEIENLSFPNESYLKANLIDKTAYQDEMLKDFQAQCAAPDSKYRLLDFDIYKETSTPLPYPGHDRIAIVFASGEIHSGYSGGEALFGGSIMGSDTLVEQLAALRQNPTVKAVVLRIDSPGGSPFASDAIRREAELLAEKKPLVISMSDLAASGGFMIALSSSRILALPQTITGSIGIVGGKLIVKEFYDKIGLKKATLKTTEFADWYSDLRPFSATERNRFIAMMRYIYDSFVELVAHSRKLEIQEVRKIAKGRVWSGLSAVELKLVDRWGGLLDAIAEAKKSAKIPPAVEIGVTIYPRKKSLLDMVQELLDSQGGNPLAHIKSEFGKYKGFFPALLLPYSIQID
ncbi:MAG: signal peptide peptidase SppA [Candidatus Aminicenantes bacterium]|nr:signal peptide peptidase SppA [Candidatus Aminicenantes bacterium]